MSARSCCSRGRRRVTRSYSRTSSPGCTWSRAIGRSWRSRRSRPAARCRSELQPRVPRAAHRASEPGLDRPAARAGRAHLLAAPRSLQAAVGDVARPGPRGQQLRPDHEDASLDGRRDLGPRPRERPVQRRPSPSPHRAGAVDSTAAAVDRGAGGRGRARFR